MYNEDDVQRIKSINKKLNSLFTIIHELKKGLYTFF